MDCNSPSGMFVTISRQELWLMEMKPPMKVIDQGFIFRLSKTNAVHPTTALKPQGFPVLNIHSEHLSTLLSSIPWLFNLKFFRPTEKLRK